MPRYSCTRLGFRPQTTISPPSNPNLHPKGPNLHLLPSLTLEHSAYTLPHSSVLPAIAPLVSLAVLFSGSGNQKQTLPFTPSLGLYHLILTRAANRTRPSLCSAPARERAACGLNRANVLLASRPHQIVIINNLAADRWTWRPGTD